MAEKASREYDTDDMDIFEKEDSIEKLEDSEEIAKEEKTVTYSEMTAADRPIFQWLKKMMIFGFVVIFLGVCIWQVNSLKKESQGLEQTMADLEKQIEEEKAKELEIKVEKEYYQSIAYRERMARDRCKLIYPNEILITIQTKK
jgi:cell division protein FtsB